MGHGSCSCGRASGVGDGLNIRGHGCGLDAGAQRRLTGHDTIRDRRGRPASHPEPIRTVAQPHGSGPRRATGRKAPKRDGRHIWPLAGSGSLTWLTGGIPHTPPPKPRSPQAGAFHCSVMQRLRTIRASGSRCGMGRWLYGSPSDPGCAQPRVGQDFPPFFVITSKLGMSDDHEVSRMRMDVAFCARLFAAIEAGLESAPIGVVTTPGTQSPKYIKAEPRPPASSLGDF
jgi:hypothetical protein